MKLSDYVASFLAGQGIRHVFAITGGASAHLIDSIAKTPGIKYICPQHEQAGAMAADAYARVTGSLAAAISTSGPGATNMLTGVCCSFYDSIPVLFITGQVSTFRSKGNTGVRQLGFQETDVVSVFSSVTKYAVKVDSPENIRYELEKAVYIARSGRPGPVLVDIPDDLQRVDINPDSLKRFMPEKKNKKPVASGKDIDRCIKLLSESKRPVVIAGWGIQLAGARKEAVRFIEKLGFPVAPTWAMMDMLPGRHPQLIGSFGTHGTRHANFAVQNADLILAIGARLDTRQAGSPHSTFARGAKKIVVDIDPYELKKFKRLNMKVDLPIQADAKDFIKKINGEIHRIKIRDISEWYRKIADWKAKFSVCRKNVFDEDDIDPYLFIKELSRQAVQGHSFFVDTGCGVAWMLQSFEFKNNQRLFSAFNNTPMGYALPASIGGAFGNGKKPVICITGDGGLQINIQELATILRHNLPVKIFLFNNHGYGMICQTQDQWFGSRYEASTIEGGLAFPDFIKVAKAYGFKTVNISRAKDIKNGIAKTLRGKGPVFCNVEIDRRHKVAPQVKFGRAIEDAEPLLNREDFVDCMIVKPHRTSLE